jgi:hypothetical protein
MDSRISPDDDDRVLESIALTQFRAEGLSNKATEISGDFHLSKTADVIGAEDVRWDSLHRL